MSVKDKFHTFQIHLEADGEKCEVILDGKKIEGLSYVKVERKPGKNFFPTVTLEMFAGGVDMTVKKDDEKLSTVSQHELEGFWQEQ
jgi:hypothetical protein